MKSISNFTFILFLLILPAYASIGELSNRTLEFTGNNSLHGNYQGEIEFREREGSIAVVRIMTYDDFTFEGLKIQEIWTGQANYDPQSDTYKVQYELRKADFLTYAEGTSRHPEDFKNKKIITQTIPVKNQQITLAPFSRDNEVFSDSFIDINSVASEPLWSNKRHRIESVAHESSSIFRLAGSLVDWKVMRWYHEQALPQQYKNREEFKLKKQYFIYDPTDYEFYQENPDFLRVVNKIPDKISLIEDIQRRNAYALKLHQKAEHFDRDMKYHINEFGMFSGSEFDETGKFKKYLVDGDSAIWTGMYLASQAMRFQVTRNPEALENVKKSLNGLMLLMDITEDPKEFARTIVKYDPDTTEKNLRRGTGKHTDKHWLMIGNNDMFKGLIHGFIWAYLTLPETELELRSQLYEHMRRLPDLRIADEIQNKAPAYGLRAIVTQSRQDKLEFQKSFHKVYMLKKMANVEGQMHLGGVVDWSGANLHMVTAITDIMIARALQIEKVETRAKKDMMYSWKDLAGSKRDFLTIAAHTFVMKDGFKLRSVNEWGDDYSTDELKSVWNNDFKKALWSLREVQINRSKYDTVYDYSLQPDWCLSYWPRSAWDSFLKKRPVDYHYQGVNGYPLFEGQGLGNSFIWKSHAFNFRGGSNKRLKEGGTDYLYSYWMARMSAMVSEHD